MADRRLRWRIACLLPILLAVSASHASADPDAVEVHEETGLSGVMTAWCLGNADEFAFAAEGLGIAFSRKEEEGKDNFASPGKTEGSLDKWAASSNKEDVATFDSACRLAYAAFSRSEARPDESELFLESQAFSAIVGAAIAGIFAVGSGAWTQRRRAHEDDAEELAALNDQLRAAMEEYTREPYSVEEGVESAAKARALRSLLGEWRKHEGGEKDVTTVRDGLTTILGENPALPLPKIGDLGGTAAERKENGEKLMAEVNTIHSLVAKIRRRVERPWRIGDRKSE